MFEHKNNFKTSLKHAIFTFKCMHVYARGYGIIIDGPSFVTIQETYYNSARALVKKTQEPGIKLQKADFFRNDTWTSPQTNSEDAPKIPLVHFF